MTLEREYVVELDARERAYGRLVGAARQRWNHERGHRNAHGLGDVDYATARELNVRGALAELAVAKCWGLPWAPLWDRLDRARPDVGNLHVRSTPRPDGDLRLHPTDPPAGVFVLVIVDGARYRLVGWLMAREGQTLAYWRSCLARPCYLVPPPLLHPIWTCPAHVEHELEAAA